MGRIGSIGTEVYGKKFVLSGGMSGSVLYSSLRNKSFRGPKINSSINNNIYKELPIPTKEWNNSIYNYNIKNIVHLNWLGGLVIKLLNSFLNGKKDNKKVFVSKLEWKHIIDKVTMFYHIFNQKNLLWKENKFWDNLMNSIYNKEVVFRVVRLKYPYLNASILVDYIVNIINSGKIRLLRSYRRIIKKTKLYKINNNNINFRELINISKESLLNIELPDACPSALGRFIKNIKLNGIIIEVAGRLTRRRSAARSLSKKGQKGSIKNIYSSIPLIGYLRSNLECYFSNSKTINGSYSVTAVISSISN